jgi:hypothetical protein
MNDYYIALVFLPPCRPSPRTCQLIILRTALYLVYYYTLRLINTIRLTLFPRGNAAVASTEFQKSTYLQRCLLPIACRHCYIYLSATAIYICYEYIWPLCAIPLSVRLTPATPNCKVLTLGADLSCRDDLIWLKTCPPCIISWRRTRHHDQTNPFNPDHTKNMSSQIISTQSLDHRWTVTISLKTNIVRLRPSDFKFPPMLPLFTVISNLLRDFKFTGGLYSRPHN